MIKSFYTYYVLLVLLLAIFYAAGSGIFRIIDGRTASPAEFPYHASIEKKFRHWCGGSVISQDTVLTAAHCVYFIKESPVPNNQLQLRVGHEVSGIGGDIYQVHSVMFHEKFSNEAVKDEFDIGLIKTMVPFQYSEVVQPVYLVRIPPEPGEMAWVVGFGKQKQMRSVEVKQKKPPRVFKAVEIPVVSLDVCKRKLFNVADDMICAGTEDEHKDACTGDSGGPLVSERGQIGIVAWGLGCGRKGVPGVYTNIAHYRTWITDRVDLAETEYLLRRDNSTY